jgi:4-hydroxy-tetrahydrodipicolinate reductase
MGPIRVVVRGALGRMGREVINAVCREKGMQIVGAVDLEVGSDSLLLPDGSGDVLLAASLDDTLSVVKPDVMVDFTIASSTIPAARMAAGNGVNLVIGTTGLTMADVEEIERLSKNYRVGAVVAPNFALGAVLMMHLAKLAAKYMDYAEIIELHHERKVDAPSGTALSTARSMAAARGKPFLRAEQKQVYASRGEQVEGINIHSVRLPGLLAHQEVILGGPGQTLSIRHDTISRECFMPGVILAIKKVIKHEGLIYGLDTLLGLGE